MYQNDISLYRYMDDGVCVCALIDTVMTASNYDTTATSKDFYTVWWWSRYHYSKGDSLTVKLRFPLIQQP